MKNIISVFLLFLVFFPLQLSGYEIEADSLTLDSLFVIYENTLHGVADSSENGDSLHLRDRDPIIFRSNEIFLQTDKYTHKIFDAENVIQFQSDDSLLAEALFICGTNLQNPNVISANKQVQTSLAFFKITHRLFPKDKYGILALKQMGDIYFEQQKYYLAKSHYWNFVFHNTDINQKAEAFFQIERCKYHVGSYQLPTEMFINYISKFPESPLTPRLCFDLGIYYYNVKKKYKSLYELEKIISNYPGVSWMDSVYYQIGIIYHDFGEWDNSIDTITQLLNKYPNSRLRKSAFDLLASDLLAHESILDAISKLNSIIFDIPEKERNEYYFILIKLYSKVGLVEEVISIYNLMIENEFDKEKRILLRNRLNKIIEKTGHDMETFDLLDTQVN